MFFIVVILPAQQRPIQLIAEAIVLFLTLSILLLLFSHLDRLDSFTYFDEREFIEEFRLRAVNDLSQDMRRIGLFVQFRLGISPTVKAGLECLKLTLFESLF